MSDKTYENLEDFYNKTFTMGSTYNPLLDMQVVQLRQIKNSLATLPKIRVLDIGCGNGIYISQLTEKIRNEIGIKSTIEVVGLDLSKDSVDKFILNTGNKAVVGSAEDIPESIGKFDLIVMNDVIEHVPNTDKVMRAISKSLANNGYLIMSTPNLAAWFNRLALLIGLQPAYSEVSYEKIFGRPGSDVVGHLRLFTYRSLVDFCNYHSFEIINFKGSIFAGLPTPARMVSRVLRNSKSLCDIHSILLRR